MTLYLARVIARGFKFICVLTLLASVTAVAIAIHARSARGHPVLIASKRAAPLKVVTTAYPLYEAALRVGGKRVRVTQVNAENPFGTLSSKHRELLNNADVIFALSENDQPQIDAALTTDFGRIERPFPQSRFGQSSIYAWQDPQIMAEASDRIAFALARYDPTHTNIFEKNAYIYTQRFARADSAFSHFLASCPGREVAITSTNMQTLFDRYAVKSRQMPSIDELVHSARQDAVVTSMGATNTRAIFTSQLPTLHDAMRLRDTYGTRIAVLDDGFAQTAQTKSARMDYVARMQVNLDAMISALDCAPKWRTRQ